MLGLKQSTYEKLISHSASSLKQSLSPAKRLFHRLADHKIIILATLIVLRPRSSRPEGQNPNKLLNLRIIKRIGITGNIGSGKTTVAKLFARLGIPVYYADEEAKALMLTEEIRTAITEKFGANAYAEKDGAWLLNRSWLGERVFKDPAALADLNAIVHPAVARHAKEWHLAQLAPYTLYEAAITFETGGDKVLDKVIVVTAPAAERLRRVQARDGLPVQQIRARMDKQWPEEKKVARADFLIENHGLKLLMPQVVRIHGALLV